MSIAEKIKSLKLPIGQYVVVASAVMEIHGIRKSNDIDIAVTPSLHQDLINTGEWDQHIKYGKVFLKKEGVDIIPQLNWEQYQTTTNDVIKSADIIEGVPFMNLEELCKFKSVLAREKDLKDIKLIKQHLSPKQKSI